MHDAKNIRQQATPPGLLRDAYARSVHYLRLSVTDRCNLNCLYCHHGAKQCSFIPHADILAYEEMLALVKGLNQRGIQKVRLTGGEPFARKDLLAFLGMLREECPEVDVRITTNGTLLASKVPAIKHLGIGQVTFSLDTLNEKKYARITGHNLYARVRRAIDECLHYGIAVKINTVAMKGCNEDELADFIAFASRYPVDVRFIEWMPIGADSAWHAQHHWSAGDILATVRQQADLTPSVHSSPTDGPARMYSLDKGQGRIGFIAALSGHFCQTCNRIRLTADGRLRPCLFSDKEYRLRPALCHSRLGVAAALDIIERALLRKPVGHVLLQSRTQLAVCDKQMSSIGG